MLKSGADAMKKSFKELGASGSGGGDTPSERLDALAKLRATEGKIDLAKAYNEVLSTTEGQELYSQMRRGSSPN